MAFETKVLLSLLADAVAKTDNVKAAYEVIARAANVEGVQLPSYDEKRKQLKDESAD